jgi:pimeloyl-ACP methyl ester carboxylesterase
MQFADTLKPFARRHRVHDQDMQIVIGGDGQPMLLIHGLQDDLDTWRHVFGPLSQRHRVIAPDLPGFGRSNKPGGRYDVARYARDVLGLMDALSIPAAHMVGSSLGAMVAEHLALFSPGRVRALTLIGGTLSVTAQPASTRGGLLRRLFPDYVDRRYFAELRADPERAFRTLEPYYASLDNLPEADQQFLRQRVMDRVNDEAQRKAALSVSQGFVRYFIGHLREIRRRTPALTLPTHVVWGEADRVFPFVNGPARAQLQPGASFTAIPNAGHLPQQEQPQALLTLLAEPLA